MLHIVPMLLLIGNDEFEGVGVGVLASMLTPFYYT